MAEFVQKKLEDMRPILEQLKKLELLSDKEIRDLTKRWKEHEYKLQRHTKSKEDFLHYIQYQMDLLKLVKLRRQKYGITKNKSDIDFTIANKINHLYKEAIFKFQDDLRFWIAYMTFCKHVKFNNCVNRMMGKMLAYHQDKPKCWHIAARWEIEENKNLENAKIILFRGLHYHPHSQLLFLDVFRLEMDILKSKIEDFESKSVTMDTEIIEVPDYSDDFRRLTIICNQAFHNIKDIKLIISLLNIAQDYKKTETLQLRLVRVMIEEYPLEPLMWDTMAKRELNGLIQPVGDIDCSIDIENFERASLRDRISNCYEVYQTAVKKIKTEEMWSLFIECMFEINRDNTTLPNFKRKLLKNTLIQAHYLRMLTEQYYINWTEMLNVNERKQNEEKSMKLYEVICWSTEAIPKSERLWLIKYRYLLNTDQLALANETFIKAIEVLEENSLSLWKLKLCHLQSTNPQFLEHFFREALANQLTISNYFKPVYLEWIALTKDIEAVRKAYDELCLSVPVCLDLHQKMAILEILQTEVSLQHARKPREIATSLFGKDNIDVWTDYITFEMKYGEVSKVPLLYDRAVKTLKTNLAEEFTIKYSLLKANPETLQISN